MLGSREPPLIQIKNAPLTDFKGATKGFLADSAANGHAAAPPSSVTNSRRLMPGMGSLPGAAADHTT
jgi:hypothetical protein